MKPITNKKRLELPTFKHNPTIIIFIAIIALSLFGYQQSQKSSNGSDKKTSEIYITNNGKSTDKQKTSTSKTSTYIEGTDTVDINGDGKKEIVLLYKTYGTDPYFETLTLSIKNSKTNTVIAQKLIGGNGKGPSLFVGDLNNDNIPEILITASTGGSDGAQEYTLLSYRENRLVEMPFNEEIFNARNYFDFILKNNKYYLNSRRFMVNVECPMPQDYIETFRKEGDKTGDFSPTWLEPVDVEKDGHFELKYTSCFSIEYKRGVGYVSILYKMTDGVWKPVSALAFPIFTVKTPADKLKALTKADMQIDSFKFDMTKNNVINILKRRPDYSDGEGNNWFEMDYNNEIGFYFNYDKMDYISVLSDKYQTPRGLKVGDKIEKLISLYGDPDKKDISIWQYNSGYGQLYVYIDDNTVTEIQISSQ